MELCSFLTKMGAEITGAGTSKIMVRGRRRLHDARFLDVYKRQGQESSGQTDTVSATVSETERLESSLPESSGEDG